VPDLATIEQDIRGALEHAETDVKAAVEQHLPALLDAARAVDADPLVQAAQAALLPPGTRQAIADLISKAADEFQPVTAPAAPAESSDTPTPAPAEQAAAPADAPAAPAGPTIAGAAT
jgi:hypothetical protein